MRVLISGGCKNGKSLYAQKIINELGSQTEKYYIATMKPQDKEDEQRIINHQNERAEWEYITVEQPTDIGDVVNNCKKNSSALLDSTTALLSNEMFGYGEINHEAHIKIIDQLDFVCDHFKNLVIVSDYIYSDAMEYDDLTEKYRFALAQIDRFLARKMDVVMEVCFGNIIFHKGSFLKESVAFR